MKAPFLALPKHFNIILLWITATIINQLALLTIQNQSTATVTTVTALVPNIPFLPPNNTLCKFATTSSSSSSIANSNSNPSSSSSSSSPSPSSLTMSLRAWTCSGKTNRDLIENLVKAGIIKTPIVRDALLRVDRQNYSSSYSYSDAPQSIGCGQTISAPHMHAHALEEIVPTLVNLSQKVHDEDQIREPDTDKKDQEKGREELNILDVGCGSGYLTAAFGRLVDRSNHGPIAPLSRGHVYGIDVIPTLVDLSRNNMLKQDGDLLESGTVTLAVGDGWTGLPSKAPFHAIHVGAAAEDFPTDLMMQLYPHGGVMVIPVGRDGGAQALYRVERLRDNDTYDKSDFAIRHLLGVRYVPLVRPVRP